MLIVLGLVFAWGCYLFYVKVLNNNSSQQVNPTHPYRVEDDGIYEDDSYIEYQEYEEEEEYLEEEEDIDFEYQNQNYYDDDTDSYDSHDTMYDEDTYRSFFSEEERY